MRINFLLFSFAFLSVTTLLAQKPKPSGGGGGNVPDQSQEVVRNFDARLVETEKQRTAPNLPNVDTATKPQAYNVNARAVTVDYLAPVLRPLSVKGKKDADKTNSELYRGYVKAGYGIPQSPFVEGAYLISEAKKYNVLLHGKHHSANYKQLPNQAFSYSAGDLSGSFFTPNGIAFDAKVGFDSDINPYYGGDSLSKADARQYFNTFEAAAKVYNSVKTVYDINYSAGLNFYNLTDNFASVERGFTFKGEATKWFNESNPLTVVIKTDFNHLDTTGETKNQQNLNNLFIQPSFTYHSEYVKARIGMNLVSFKDDFYPLPDLELSGNIVGSQLVAYAGWKGDFIANTYRNLGNTNPYIFSRSVIKNTRFTEYFGGIKGNLGTSNYQIQLGYADNKDLPLFLQDTTDSKGRFNVLYDTVKVFNVRGTLALKPIQQLQITATVSNNIYTLSQNEKAWGLPSFDVNLGAKYAILPDGKANAKVNFFAQNGVPYVKGDGTAGTLQALYDVSVGGEVLFGKNFGAFIDINNLFNNKRERWYNYPTFGTNLLAGITARF